MAARSRADYYSRSDSRPLPLTCVHVVCHNGPAILRLHHIVAKLDEFLDSSCKWTLSNACKSDSTRLVERILVSHEAEVSSSFLHYPVYRQRQFNQSLEEAVEVGNFRIVQLLTMHFQDCRVSFLVVGTAARRGLSQIVEWLIDCGCDVDWGAEAVRDAIGGGHFELAKWLQERLPIASVYAMTEWAEVAAGKGYLAMVKWVCEMFSERDANGRLRYLSGDVDLWRVVQSATNSGQLNVLKWIMDEPNRKVLLDELVGQEFKRTSPVHIALSEAAGGGHIAVLTWLIQHYPEMCNADNADLDAARNGHLEILRLLLSSPIEKWTSSIAMYVAAGKGHLDIIKFLVVEGYPVYRAMDNAAEYGSLDVVRWLHENTISTSQSCTKTAMDSAASKGHLDVVKWLHHNREEGCTARAMDNAAIQGHLLVVQWLHENRTEGCTTRAMDVAASNGNLEMVKWLHFHRPEGCTTFAMDHAAENGHLDVVKWLHANRPEGCTLFAMDFAAGNNQLAMLKWLDQNRTEGFTSAAIDVAVCCGNLEVLQWLLSCRPDLCMTSAINEAAIWGHFDVVWFLHQKFREYGYDAIETLKNGLVPSSRLGFAEWAYTHHRREFELNIADQLFADLSTGI